MMTCTQFRNGRVLTEKVNTFVLGQGDADVYDLLDEIQLAYNDDLLSEQDYEKLIGDLEGYIPN